MDKTGDVWTKPIADGKWSIREFLAHIMHWDWNSLDKMVPLMSEGARLSFVDIERHNREAADIALTYDSFAALIEDVVRTRSLLVAELEERYDDKTRFSIDGHPLTYRTFVDNFIEHDEHHRRQIEAVLEQAQSA